MATSEKKPKLESCINADDQNGDQESAVEESTDGLNGTTEVAADGSWLKESDVGITEYVGDHKGFFGVIKKRFSDFIVNEIDTNNQIVSLTNLDPPEDLSLAPEKKEGSKEFLSTILTPEQFDQLKVIVSKRKSRAGDQESDKIEIDVTEMDKDKRKRIHASVATLYKTLYSTTVVKKIPVEEIKAEGEPAAGSEVPKPATKELKLITISRVNEWKGSKNNWNHPDSYIHFTAYQENRGTMEMLNAISRIMYYNVKSFSYCGTKDKRGISAQRVSAYKCDPLKLLRVNDLLNEASSPIAVGNISFEKEQLKLGQLSGNRFKMVLRDVTCDMDGGDTDAIISKAFTEIEAKGFLNYFGIQRFGSSGVRSDRVGKLILEKKWQDAVLSVLSLKKRDMRIQSKFNSPSFNDCIKMYHDNPDNVQEVYKKFFWKQQNEGIILSKLAQNSANFKNALLAIPRNNRTMYIHAYQSYVWNKLLSFRIQKYGPAKVLLGDLLVFGPDPDSSIDAPQLDSKPAKVIPVYATEENIEKATIFDVVLPLVAAEVLLPNNDQKDLLMQLLKDDGVALDDFKTAADFNMSGGYRKIMIKPQDLKWSIVNYEDETIRLFPSDLDLLYEEYYAEEGHQTSTESASPTSGSKKGVKIEVSLPSSCYATCFTRELLKRDLATTFSHYNPDAAAV